MKRLCVILTIVGLMFSLPISAVLAQDACEGNFDCDQDVDGTDAIIFKKDFGRSQFTNPCDTCTDSPCPCIDPGCGPPASVEKTGQTTTYATGDDGDSERGVAWPNPRFTDNGNDTVTDNLTGLIWLKDANCIATNYPGFDNDGTPEDGRVTWQHALDFVEGINNGTYPVCGSGNIDWRLPNRRELFSMVHDEYYSPSVPDTAGTGKWSEGDPFNNVQSNSYWSSTTYARITDDAWYVYMYNGNVITISKTSSRYVWPVRRGQ